MASDRSDEIGEIRSQMNRLLDEVRSLQDRVEAIEDGDVDARPGRTKGRIVICDDTRLIRVLMRSVLAGAGYHVSEAGNGQEALELLREENFDLLIADIHMPDVDGAALLKDIRLVLKDVDLPVIICSGSREKKDYLRVGQYGVQGIIQKPIKNDELLSCVREVLRTSTAKQSEDDRGIFDPVSALNRIGGDVELLTDLIADFLRECPKLLASVRKAVTGGTAEDLADASHAFKGVLLSIGAPAAAGSAEALEGIGREGDVRDARDSYATLEAEIRDLRDELEAYQKASR